MPRVTHTRSSVLENFLPGDSACRTRDREVVPASFQIQHGFEPSLVRHYSRGLLFLYRQKLWLARKGSKNVLSKGQESQSVARTKQVRGMGRGKGTPSPRESAAGRPRSAAAPSGSAFVCARSYPSDMREMMVTSGKQSSRVRYTSTDGTTNCRGNPYHGAETGQENELVILGRHGPPGTIVQEEQSDEVDGSSSSNQPSTRRVPSPKLPC